MVQLNQLIKKQKTMKEENSNINIGTKGTLKVKYVEGNVKEITAELVEIKSKYFFKCYDVFGKPWYGHTEAPISDFTPFPNSDKKAQECDATAASSSAEPLAQKKSSRRYNRVLYRLFKRRS